MSTQQIGFQSYMDTHNAATNGASKGMSPYVGNQSYKACFHTPVLLFSRDHVNYYGAAKPDRLEKAPANAVYISLCGDYLSEERSLAVIHDARFTGLEEHVNGYSTPAICIDWRDYDTAPVANTFWRELHNKLAALDP